MDFPDGGAPAVSLRFVGKFAVVVRIRVGVIEHKLPYDFHLLATLAIEPENRPFCVARVGRHFRHNACLFGLARTPGVMDGRICPNLIGKRRVEADSQMEVERIVATQLTIAGLAPMARGDRCILDKIQISHYGMNIALAKIGQLIGKLRMVRAPNVGGYLVFQGDEITDIERAGWSETAFRLLVLEEVQVCVVSRMSRVGASGRHRGMTIRDGCHVAAIHRGLTRGLRRKLMSAIRLSPHRNGAKENKENN
jgi:hypothetical protein